MVMLLPDCEISTVRLRMAASVEAYLVPVISTVFFSQPVISTEPLELSTLSRPPGSTSKVLWKSSLYRSPSPKSSKSQLVRSKGATARMQTPNVDRIGASLTVCYEGADGVVPGFLGAIEAL